MPKFVIKDTIPCYVTYLYEVTAKDEDEAYDIFYDGIPSDHHEISDSIGWLDGSTTISAA